MFGQRPRARQTIGSILALAGLLLMIASFVWMQRIPGRQRPVKPQIAQPQPTPKPFVVVVLDPGHGGQDSGAICGGVLEKDLTLDVARRIERLLEAEDRKSTRLNSSHQ